MVWCANEDGGSEHRSEVGWLRGGRGSAGGCVSASMRRGRDSTFYQVLQRGHRRGRSNRVRRADVWIVGGILWPEEPLSWPSTAVLIFCYLVTPLDQIASHQIFHATLPLRLPSPPLDVSRRPCRTHALPRPHPLQSRRALLPSYRCGLSIWPLAALDELEAGLFDIVQLSG